MQIPAAHEMMNLQIQLISAQGEVLDQIARD